MNASYRRSGGTILARIEWEGDDGSSRAKTVEVEGLPAEADVSGDFLLPLTLLPAMATGGELVIPRVESPRLLRQSKEIQFIFSRWFPRCFSPVLVRFSGDSTPLCADAASRGTAAFFSGGVDSFYTALELRPELDALIYVTGFDHGIGRAAEPDGTEIQRSLTAAADALGMPLVSIRTSLRRFSDPLVLWGDHYVGSALGAVALAVSPWFSLVYVPATHTYDDLFPYGTHPLIDPLWTSDSVEIRMHGCDVPRPAKIARVARSQAALDTLRVCWENTGGTYNCGRCRKCMLTAVALRSAGALQRCSTLPQTIDLQELATIRASDDSGRAFVRMARDAVRGSGDPDEREIDRILSDALSRKLDSDTVG
jgi:hypothetical protein